VLVAGAKVEGAALFLAARGCDVTAVEPAADAVERVLSAAEAAGLTSRVRGYVSDLGHWQPDVALQAVVCTPEAFDGLTQSERSAVIRVLQSATTDGGVHLVETIVAGRTAMTLEELRSSYNGWQISVERELEAPSSFFARKGCA
jgi:tRNA1(Val) A37 N6-methylase TrmN6